MARIMGIRPPERVRELCRELDCVPRLIEFAAYWLRSVPVSALLRPEHVLELLGIPDVSALPHQRSMRGSLEWSWGMLAQRQRQFMVRLAERPEPVASDGLESTALEPEFTRTLDSARKTREALPCQPDHDAEAAR